MAISANNKRAIVDLLLTILTCILNFLVNHFGQKAASSTDSETTDSGDETTDSGNQLTKAQQRKLARAAKKAQTLIE